MLAHRRATPFERPVGPRADLDDLLDEVLRERVDGPVDAHVDEPSLDEGSLDERSLDEHGLDECSAERSAGAGPPRAPIRCPSQQSPS